MKIKELIEMLEDEDPNMEVRFTYNYGDYERTTVAAPISESNSGRGYIKKNEYIRGFSVIEDEDVDHGEKEVFLLA